ncbi:MAG: acyltransferase [Gammaproteobacteria bacterium]|nr:acyltransferase [Alphaproteobacteria bacterium]MBU1444626.1 acyltransferase [Gammaproteobacteria bacterium]MBU1796719.1 acyltransferase [Alphaproteobacteria bacterium]|tara:strand:- start:8504 stop:10354 length:1851 start_codon:yes stop_codon:yes gene_type:complete
MFDTKTIIHPSAHDVRRDIQGFRALAVLAVLVFHVNKDWLPSGFTGVDMFLVISGFIITSTLLKQRESVDWKLFYWARVRRILPAYMVMLTVVTLLAAWLFLPDDFAEYQDSLSAALGFYSNFYFAEFGSYFAPASHELPLLHTWSLAIEMQFYLLYPLLFGLTSPRYRPIAMAVLVMVMLGYSQYQLSVGQTQEAYFSSLGRAGEFLIGALLAVTSIGRNWSSRVATAVGGVGLALIAAGFTVVDQGKFPGVLALLPCVGTVLLIAARNGKVNVLFSHHIAVWVGGLSYSIYLWHWPLLAIQRYYTGSYEITGLAVVLIVSLTLFVSVISSRYVEMPARRWKFTPSGAGRAIAALSICVLVILAAPRLGGEQDTEYPAEMSRYAIAEEICHGRLVGNCLRGDQHKPPTALVIGDSHGAQLNYFFDVAGQAEGFSVKIITASSCVPVPDFDVERLPEYAQEDCRNQIKAVQNSINDFNVIVLAGKWRWHFGSQRFLSSIRSFLGSSAAAGKKVIVFGQIPMFDGNLLRARHFETLGLPAAVHEDAEWRNANKQIKELVTKFPDVHFVDYSASTFFASAPFDNGELMYMDAHHLNETGAMNYGRYAASDLARLLKEH